MKKISSDVNFTFRYNGEISVDLSSKGTVVSDDVAEAAAKRFPFVKVSEVKDIKKEVKEAVEKEVKGDSEAGEAKGENVAAPEKKEKKSDKPAKNSK